MTIPKFAFALRPDLVENKEFLPTRAYENDTGWDVRCAQTDRKPITLKPFDYFMIPLGFRAFVPAGFWYELKPRSSTFAKKRVHALIGTVDENFPLEAKICGQYIPGNEFNTDTLTLNFGDAIGQIIPIRRQEMEIVDISNKELDELIKNRNSSRTGGFGSSDKTRS